MLAAISPVDGRYQSKTQSLSKYFSEQALIRYRLFVECEYFIRLSDSSLKYFPTLSEEDRGKIRSIYNMYTEKDGTAIKNIEGITNHDVKAVEYFLKEKLDELGLQVPKEYVHFGLTSQDINNTSFPLMLRDALKDVIYPQLQELLTKLKILREEWKDVPMLARTHGQAASPSALGKEVAVFIERLSMQIEKLDEQPIYAKFGGATGNFNAHKVTFPQVDWKLWADDFIAELGLKRLQHTTQIAHYDHMANVFDLTSRICTICMDFCRDFWTYISRDYFGQKVNKNEVGSSAMPHKVNPIDFENAEGNLGIAIAIFNHLSNKLPISRLQRDLTDSTVLRNIGVPYAHLLIAIQSMQKGMGKLLLREEVLAEDLEDNWVVVAEGIQNILRREQYPAPYEALKKFTRGKARMGKDEMDAFIESLDVDEDIKKELRAITPFNYLGYK